MGSSDGEFGVREWPEGPDRNVYLSVVITRPRAVGSGNASDG